MCLRAKAFEWATRVLHEMNYHPLNVFATLTYDDDHLPKDGSISKEEAQRFLKRFRRRLDGRSIKYYMCGEYGENTYRPHYHLIMFNVGFCDFKPHPLVRGFYIHDAWPHGHIFLGSVEAASIRYVSNYVTKKRHRPNLKVEKPFQLQSQGIGKQFALDNSDQIIDNLDITINGVHVSIPRYYKKLLDIETERLLDNRKDRVKDIEDKLVKRGIKDEHMHSLNAKEKYQKMKTLKSKDSQKDYKL